jgi:hypothetical protein
MEMNVPSSSEESAQLIADIVESLFAYAKNAMQIFGLFLEIVFGSNEK